MSEQNDLATLLDNAQSQTPQPTEAKVEPTPEPPKTETVEANVPTGEKQDAAPPAESVEGDDGSGMVPRKVALDERRKRQELERQLAELTKQRAAPQAPQQAQPQNQQDQQPDLSQGMPERPDPWIDPQGAMDWDRALLQRQIDQTSYETRTSISREFMRQSKPDFEEMENVFFQALPQMPHLGMQLRRHQMPAKFAYEMGVKIKAMAEIGDDPAAYKQRVRQELEEELRSQSQQQPAQAQAPKASTPKSLAATPSAQPRDDRGRFQGPASLESILGG